jgi:hypothetical protein
VVALWYLLLLAPFVALAVLWFNYRRKQAAREREAMQRWQRVVVAKPAAAEGAEAAPRAAATAALRPRLLEPADALFYRLLTASLPDHDVFAGVGANRVLAAGGSATAHEREASARAWSRLSIDFLICDKSLRPRVAVLLDAGADRFALAEALRGAGLRCVSLARNGLPRRQDVRALILGDPAAPPRNPGDHATH